MLVLTEISFQVSFSTTHVPPHLPFVSTLLIAAFNSLHPGSPRAAAAIRAWGPSSPHCCSVLRTKGSRRKGHTGELHTSTAHAVLFLLSAHPTSFPIWEQSTASQWTQNPRQNPRLSLGSINLRMSGKEEARDPDGYPSTLSA